jgi:hypothetical protein
MNLPGLMMLVLSRHALHEGGSREIWTNLRHALLATVSRQGCTLSAFSGCGHGRVIISEYQNMVGA